MQLNYIRFSLNDSISATPKGRKAPFFVNASSHQYGEIGQLDFEPRFPIGKFDPTAVSYRKNHNSYTIGISYSIGNSKTPIGIFKRLPNSYRKYSERYISYRKANILYSKFQTYSRLFAFGNADDQGSAV